MDNFWIGLLLGIALLGCLRLNLAAPQKGGSETAKSVCPPGLVWFGQSDQCLPNCPEGYRSKKGTCEPVCIPECDPDGFCAEPSVCLCKVGYKMNKGLCDPICDSCGPNEYCAAPGDCDCIEGFERDAFNRCQSRSCHPGCGPHGFCHPGNLCECHVGYSLQNGTCQAACAPDCGPPRRCVAPNVCSCARGFKWHEKRHKCLPQCMPPCGVHSFCESPNHCKCHTGFVSNNDQNLSCSRPLEWWLYWALGLMGIIVIVSLIIIIVFWVKRHQQVSYYPNVTFSDTATIIDERK